MSHPEAKRRHSTCPQCLARSQAAAAMAAAEAEAGYGKVPMVEFLKLHGDAVSLGRVASNLAASAGPKTLKELPGYGLTGGLVCMDYEAACSACGFAVAEEFSRPFTVKLEEASECSPP